MSVVGSADMILCVLCAMIVFEFKWSFEMSASNYKIEKYTLCTNNRLYTAAYFLQHDITKKKQILS